MDIKTIGIGIAALILGFLGGTMLSGNRQPAMNQDTFDTIIQTPESRDMMIESMMNDDASRAMIEEKVIKQDEESMMDNEKDADTEGSMMEEKTESENESMMEESPTGAMEK